MKNITSKILTILLFASFLLAGCGVLSSGKIYFEANLWKGGKMAEETLGTCVYDGLNIKKLYRYYIAPSVSPDGSMLFAFVLNSKKEFVFINLKTKEEVRRTIPTGTISGNQWFSDNRRIAYIGYEKSDDKNVIYNIYIYNYQTDENVRITSYEKQNLIISGLSISPDGKKIVYDVRLGSEYGSGSIVKIIDINNRQEEELPFSASNLAWSPDGKTIAISGIYSYKGKKEFGSRIILYDVKTKNYKKLDKPGGNKAYMWESDLAYSPDSKKIAFVRNENNGIRTLCVMNADGANRNKIASNRAISHVSWSK